MNDVLFEEFRTGVRIPPPPYLLVIIMGSTTRTANGISDKVEKPKLRFRKLEWDMTEKKKTSRQVKSVPPYEDEFDFVDAYSSEDSDLAESEELLEENAASSAINCAFIGVGGGGGKLAKAFLDIGFSRTILVNTTTKDQPDGVDENNFLLIPGADGVGKDVDLGRKILQENSAMVEDAVRARLGTPDWIFVLAGGGGGTGSACTVLHDSLQRSLTSAGASGKVVYIVSKPSAQELLNSTIANNYEKIKSELNDVPHI